MKVKVVIFMRHVMSEKCFEKNFLIACSYTEVFMVDILIQVYLTIDYY